VAGLTSFSMCICRPRQQRTVSGLANRSRRTFLASLGVAAHGGTAAVAFAAEVFPTRVRGTGTNLVAASEWIGFVLAGLTGPFLLNHVGYSFTLTLWCVISPLVAAAAALSMRRVAPGKLLEEVHR
jgi:hypothetical protein